MKTTKRTSRTLPSLFRVSIYLILVAIFCLFNWTVLHAQNPGAGANSSLEERLADALVPVAEPELAIEDWMLTFANDHEAVPVEEAIALEDWMLNLSQDYPAEGAEPEIALESWMVDQDEFLSAPETELAVEGWMVEVLSWYGSIALVRR